MTLSYFATCTLVIPGWEFITLAVPPGPLIITLLCLSPFLFLSITFLTVLVDLQIFFSARRATHGPARNPLSTDSTIKI